MVPELDIRMLAYALQDDKTMLSMASAVEGKYYHPDCQAFWKLVLKCFTKYKEIPTSRVLETVSGSAWNQGLSDLYEQASVLEIDPREYPMDLENMKRRHNERVLLKAGEAVFKNNFDGKGFANLEEANKVMKNLSVDIDRIYSQESFEEGSAADCAQDAWNAYCSRRDNPQEAEGIHVGFKEFDRITNGLQKSELMLIGGESGAGKSALMMNMCVNAWLGKNKVPTRLDQKVGELRKGRSIAYFSLEMPFEAFQRRLHACVAGVPLYGLRDGNLTTDETERYRAALRFIQKYPHQFYIIDIPRGATMRHVEVKYLELCQMYPGFEPELVGIDYITLMNTHGSDEKEQDWIKLGRLSEQLHEFGRVYGVRAMSPVQLNRPPKKGSEAWQRPDQDRIARSSMMSQNANIVITIEKRKDEHLLKDMRVHIIKMRDGEQSILELQKRLDVMRLYDSMVDWSPQTYADGYGRQEKQDAA